MPKRNKVSRKQKRRGGGDIEEGPEPLGPEHYPLPPKYNPQSISREEATSFFNRSESPIDIKNRIRDEETIPNWSSFKIGDSSGGRRRTRKYRRSRKSRKVIKNRK